MSPCNAIQIAEMCATSRVCAEVMRVHSLRYFTLDGSYHPYIHPRDAIVRYLREPTTTPHPNSTTPSRTKNPQAR